MGRCGRQRCLHARCTRPADLRPVRLHTVGTTHIHQRCYRPECNEVIRPCPEYCCPSPTKDHHSHPQRSPAALCAEAPTSWPQKHPPQATLHRPDRHKPTMVCYLWQQPQVRPLELQALPRAAHPRHLRLYRHPHQALLPRREATQI